MISTLQALLSLVLPVAVVAGTKTSGAEPTRTLDNLQKAFNGESNANRKYLAFARKADEEGHGEVASLFRAAAKAEEIHAASHAAVIRKLGTSPRAEILDPEVKSTRENLEAALAGEVYERDVMYPEFIDEAKASRDTDALRTFRFAIKAEAEHARLYTEALKNLPKLRGEKKKYFVCLACGYTTETLNFLRCLVCGEPKEKYIAVE